jgi:hypothetical protein
MTEDLYCEACKEDSTKHPDQLATELLEVLKRYSCAEWEYHNPHFLMDITTAISDYYNIEDVGVDKWVEDMWSA